MPTLAPRQPPPPDYYARNVRYLLDQVEQRSGEILQPAECRLIDAFRGLSTDAQRLFARLMTRSRPWLRVDTLRYPEVGDPEAALAELYAARLAAPQAALPADVLLGLLTRAELAELFPEVRGRTKAQWLEQCLSRYPDRLIRHRMGRTHRWIGVTGRAAFDVCQVLFFGGDTQDLTTFVVQDLGIRRYECYPLDTRTRPFQTRRQLERYLCCRRLSAHARSLDEAPNLAGLILRSAWPAPESRIEQRARDRLLNRLGRWHERRGELAEAQDCYGRSTGHPARERLARLAHRLGDPVTVNALLEDMRADPWAPEEADFAARFPGRRRRGAPRMTTCALGGGTPDAIEHHALRLLTANGGRGWHLENLLPLGLAGLAFWDEVFAAEDGAFSHPFQLGPRDLFWPDFARRRRRALRCRMASFDRPGVLADRLREVHDAKRGTANRLVHWSALTAGVLETLVANVPHTVLAALAAHTVQNLHRARTGFPDLLVVYGPGAWELVEVKGPGDQLQPAQRVWLGTLASLRAPARVLRFKPAC